jgi:CRP/FNR family nitrogen fixation transcriptional regulator
MDGHMFQAEIVERIERHGVLARSECRASALTRWMIGVPMKVRASHEIYGEWETADYVYEVTSGAVRTVKLFADGGRQIGAFYFAGDIFGLEDGLDHSFSAEAIVDSKIRVIKRRTLFHMAGKDRELARQLLLVSTREMARLHRHALMLGQTAEERLCSFLLEMAERISVGGLIELPMSRQDIADYLGVSIETVSRTFTTLTARSAIALPNSRAVVLRNGSPLTE